VSKFSCQILTNVKALLTDVFHQVIVNRSLAWSFYLLTHSEVLSPSAIFDASNAGLRGQKYECFMTVEFSNMYRVGLQSATIPFLLDRDTVGCRCYQSSNCWCRCTCPQTSVEEKGMWQVNSCPLATNHPPNTPTSETSWEKQVIDMKEG